MRSRVAFIASGIAFCVVAFGLYYFFPKLDETNTLNSALVISKVTIIGLALVVTLMAGLGVVYWSLGIADKQQALGLPEGSVRALIAFSLVLAFLCMAAFLYSGAGSTETASGRQLRLITQAQLDDLKTQFTVAYEPARKDNQEPVLDSDGKSLLFNATYYPRRSQAADDLGKQIFTTLATVFVSVVSFYFGSATTTSAIAAGAKAATGDGGGNGPDGPSEGQPPTPGTVPQASTPGGGAPVPGGGTPAAPPPSPGPS